jgi:hypothetical protein
VWKCGKYVSELDHRATNNLLEGVEADFAIVPCRKGSVAMPVDRIDVHGGSIEVLDSSSSPKIKITAVMVN